jgi:hypothetical protein
MRRTAYEGHGNLALRIACPLCLQPAAYEERREYEQTDSSYSESTTSSENGHFILGPLSHSEW